MYTHRLIVWHSMRMIYECKCRDNCTCVHIHVHSTIGVAKNISSTHNFMTTVEMEIGRLQAKLSIHVYV